MYRNGEFSKLPKTKYFSQPEYNLFESVVVVGNLNSDDYYSCLDDNQFFKYSEIIRQAISYDFVYKPTNKIIEFNGDYWHCNPKYYDKNYFHKHRKKYAYEIWNIDDIKTRKAIESGYEIKVVWENEYKQNPDKIIDECIKFLNKI